MKLKIVDDPQDAGSTGGPALGDLDDDEMFAAEEVEAAQIMFDAFRAVKGPDGESGHRALVLLRRRAGEGTTTPVSPPRQM